MTRLQLRKLKRILKSRHPYVQYVYHRAYPHSSLDVRTFDGDMIQWVSNEYKELTKYGLENNLTQTGRFNRDVYKRILKDHFPEELV